MQPLPDQAQRLAALNRVRHCRRGDRTGKLAECDPCTQATRVPVDDERGDDGLIAAGRDTISRSRGAKPGALQVVPGGVVRAAPEIAQALTRKPVALGGVEFAGVIVGGRGAARCLCPGSLEAASAVVAQGADLDPPGWPADRRPERRRRRDHQISMLILGAHGHPHIPCRREVDLERVQFRDQPSGPSAC
jgi:hypothetical protein